MGSIDQILQKIKPFYNIFLLIFVAIIFFSLGRLYVLRQDKAEIKIQYPDKESLEGNLSQTSSAINSVSSKVSTTTTVPSDLKEGGGVIGSKSGKKYYFPWCGTVKRIKPENQVHFLSIEEARKAGFIAGGNCKGLK